MHSKRNHHEFNHSFNSQISKCSYRNCTKIKSVILTAKRKIIPTHPTSRHLRRLDLAIQQINLLYLDFCFCFAFLLSVSLYLCVCEGSNILLVKQV